MIHQIKKIYKTMYTNVSFNVILYILQFINVSVLLFVFREGFRKNYRLWQKIHRLV